MTRTNKISKVIGSPGHVVLEKAHSDESRISRRIDEGGGAREVAADLYYDYIVAYPPSGVENLWRKIEKKYGKDFVKTLKRYTDDKVIYKHGNVLEDQIQDNLKKAEVALWREMDKVLQKALQKGEISP